MNALPWPQGGRRELGEARQPQHFCRHLLGMLVLWYAGSITLSMLLRGRVL